MNAVVLAQPGTLIHARGREWVVLPESSSDLLLARPLGGLDEEIAGILPAIEPVASAAFSLPSLGDIGDFRSGRLLREAARLSTRAAAGPFRSFARIAVEPRPYQLVPLMMALKLDPVRLLIADDVGIGKTVEATLIARELLDRGEIHRLAVLCPPHLAEQWRQELADKFHIEAELVLSSTIQRLERDLPIGQSVFDRHRFVVVSTDFIKSERRAADFALKCPEFVIVDEAHGCTLAGGVGRGRQQRFALIRDIARDPARHLVLVTATPHSGNEGAFRSLLGLLDEAFFQLPDDLARKEREDIRQKLARHLVQRRRADIRRFLEVDTAFPTRLDKEATYTFSRAYRQLFDDLVDFAREFVAGADGERHRRVRYWSALALLRCVSSSPAAAAATLRNRAAVDTVEAVDDVEMLGQQTVLDLNAEDEDVTLDFSPGAASERDAEATRRALLRFAQRAEALAGTEDAKLQGALPLLKALLSAGFRPIVFCRFVETAEYVARYMREALPKARIEAVTGLLPPTEREARITALMEEGGAYLLVCTDCLSEGVNLQQAFNAVLHYDLCWNPTRHEQREGRVDRFGQSQPEVRVITYYGQDNPIDGVILDVLIRKHKSIKSDLGVTVAVPGSSEQVARTLFEGALFRGQTGGGAQQLRLDLGAVQPKIRAFHQDWENARDQEKASRSRFAQHTLAPEVVAAELQNVRDVIGRSAEVARFFRAVLQTANIPLTETAGAVTVPLSLETPRALRQALGHDEPFIGRFELPLMEGELYLGRTSPIIEGLAGWTLDQALDPAARDPQTPRPVAARCGVIRTSAVQTRVTLLLARFRFHLHTAGAGGETLLCEDIAPLAATGSADAPHWLSVEDSERMLAATPDSNLVQTLIEQQWALLSAALPVWQAALQPIASERANVQREAHERVRQAAKSTGRVTIEPVLPVDILGAYLLLPRLSP